MYLSTCIELHLSWYTVPLRTPDDMIADTSGRSRRESPKLQTEITSIRTTTTDTSSILKRIQLLVVGLQSF